MLPHVSLLPLLAASVCVALSSLSSSFFFFAFFFFFISLLILFRFRCFCLVLLWFFVGGFLVGCVFVIQAPVPVMHSPPRKLSSEEQAQWKIPPAVSSWKNAKGYIIPLDKRLAADGRGLQENTVSDGFAKLSEALYVAERKAREEVEARAKLRVAVSRKQKEQQEMEMRNLAAAAREKRTVGGREAEDEDVRPLFFFSSVVWVLLVFFFHSHV